MSIAALSLAKSALFDAVATKDSTAQSGASLGAGHLSDTDPDLCPTWPVPHPHQSLTDLLGSMSSLSGASLGSQARFIDEFCGNGPRPLPHGA